MYYLVNSFNPHNWVNYGPFIISHVTDETETQRVLHNLNATQPSSGGAKIWSQKNSFRASPLTTTLYSLSSSCVKNKMFSEQESYHYNLSLVLFIPFWLLLISLVGSYFSASSWKTEAPQGSVLVPLFSDFIHHPCPVVLSTAMFFTYLPHWIEAQV